ncbi:hypothetical protein BDF21DRAFT_463512 [Thamnidium elegans]|nr:hypothetical protein BDF21DRAFT_463512 [Thamnidium elegans]
MYSKIRKRQEDPFLRINNNKNFLDRDSGIVTELDSDIDTNARPHYIFSDDDEDVNMTLNALGDINNIPRQDNSLLQFNSPSYYTSLADHSVISIRNHLKDSEWKKVLKHKSGTTVYMLQNSLEKTAFFRGESIIQGFTPQSIFYVIGMRKLWDEQFDEGKLIENLNDTTSLTYESYKSTATSKPYDVTLVEKIECSTDGEILFACTSVDTPKLPKTPGKNRNQVKLQGWVLKQLSTTPVSTKVTYITQESIKGWIPGLTKKSLARKPLVIASIDNYLKKKADRLRIQQTPPPSSSTLSSNTSSSNQTPLRLSPQSILQHSNISNSSNNISIHTQPSPTLGPLPDQQLLQPPERKYNTVILSNPPPRLSSLSSRPSSTATKHITFADEVSLIDRPSSSTTSSSASSSARSSLDPVPEDVTTSNPLSPIRELASPTIKKDFGTQAVAGSKLYPASRHRSARKQCMDQLKSYANSDISNWKLIGERNNRTKLYTQSVEGSKLPVMRSDSTFYGAWTPEQICSVVQCFGARKIWDEYLEDGHVVERFSQKEYLVYMEMKSLFPIQSRDFSVLTCIESNVTTGGIYVASTSVSDELIPPVSHHMRGSFITYGWALEPLRSTQHRLIGVKATFIAHLDMAGVTPLPSAISRLLTTEVPACIDRVQNYLRQNGCPPYIRRVAGKIILETFNDKEKEYQIQFIAKHAPSARQYRSKNTSVLQSMWCTDLRTHPSMYPFGYSIETQPVQGIRVEMRPDTMGLRIYTEKNELDGKTVQVFIRQNLDCKPGAKPTFYWNNLLLNEQDVEDERIEARADESITVTKETGKESNHMNKVQEERRNSHVVILNDELSFTGHQFSFIILLMAICYYLELTQDTTPFPFLQYTFGQRLKTSLPPFSKLFFTSNIKYNMLEQQHKIPNDPFQVIHDPELCMFLIKLDSKGSTAAICYLPTTVKNVIETYHIEIPFAYRHMGLGDKLVKECLDWAKESGTLIIPTCAFVQRHLECVGLQKYDPVLVLPPQTLLKKANKP